MRLKIPLWKTLAYTINNDDFGVCRVYFFVSIKRFGKTLQIVTGLAPQGLGPYQCQDHMTIEQLKTYV